MIKAIDRFIKRLENFLAYVLSLAIVCIVTAQVVFRFVLSRPLSWSQEVSTYLLIWMVLLGIVIAEREGGNISIRMVTKYFRKYDAVLRWIPWIAMAVFFAIFGLGGLEIALTNTGDKSPAARIPLWIVLMGFPVSSLFGFWHLAMEMLKFIKLGKDEANGSNLVRAVHHSAGDGKPDHGGYGNRDVGIARHK